MSINRKVMELPDFIEAYKIPHSVIHKKSGISYQNLKNIVDRREISKVFISCNIKTGSFRIYRADMASGTFDTDLFKQVEE
jgi:dUTPase